MEENKKGEEMRLDLAVDLNFDQAETRAYKFLLFWLDWSRKLFPDYKHQKMTTRKDPRKSHIFNICYKLQRETLGVLDESLFQLYVRSQVEILKALSKHNNKILISPACLTGKKAWIRWLLWKKKYDNAVKVISSDGIYIPKNQTKMTDALLKTKEFLLKTFGKENYTVELLDTIKTKKIHQWIILNKISPYYLILSSIFSKVNLEELTTLDLEVYRQVITPEITNFFDLTFANER